MWGQKLHPVSLPETPLATWGEIEAFLSHLATQRKVSISIRRQAMSTLSFSAPQSAGLATLWLRNALDAGSGWHSQPAGCTQSPTPTSRASTHPPQAVDKRPALHTRQVGQGEDGFFQAALGDEVGAAHAGQQAAVQRGGEPLAVQRHGNLAVCALGQLALRVVEQGVKHRLARVRGWDAE